MVKTLWPHTIETSTENLHKNYRVCGNHFESPMFLNNLRNRLQPHAFPIPLDNNLPQNLLLISNNQIFSNNNGKNVTNFIVFYFFDINIKN